MTWALELSYCKGNNLFLISVEDLHSTTLQMTRIVATIICDLITPNGIISSRTLIFNMLNGLRILNLFDSLAKTVVVVALSYFFLMFLFVAISLLAFYADLDLKQEWWCACCISFLEDLLCLGN